MRGILGKGERAPHNKLVNKIKPYFEELLKSGKDECVEKFGVNSKLCLGHDNFPTYKSTIRLH